MSGYRTGSSPSNQWIYQKNCGVCRVALGFGQHRQRKLYCRVCRRAICPTCAVLPTTSPSKESLCRQCNAFQLQTPTSLFEIPRKAETKRINSVEIMRSKPLFGGSEKYEEELGEVKDMEDREICVGRGGEGVETVMRRMARRNSDLVARVSALEQRLTELERPHSTDISQVPSKTEACLHCALF